MPSAATLPPSTLSEAAPPPWLAAMLSVLQQQNQQMVSVMDKLLEKKAASTVPAAIPLPSPDPYGDFVRDLPTFTHDDDTTFKDWFCRYGPVINDRGSSLTDDRKRNLLLDKLDRQTHKTYSDYVLPREPRQIDLTTTVDKLRLTQADADSTTARVPAVRSAAYVARPVPRLQQQNKEEIRGCFNERRRRRFSEVPSILNRTDRFLPLGHHASTAESFNCLKEDDPSPSLYEFVNDCEKFVALRSDNPKR